MCALLSAVEPRIFVLDNGVSNMGVEWENAREALRLAKKDTPSHITLVLGLYARSCKERELGQVARASYFFMRQMDDILDGDMQIRGNPLALAQSIRQQEDLKSNPCLQGWFKEECRSSINDLVALQEFLVQNGETLTNTICGRITKWMIRFANDNSTTN